MKSESTMSRIDLQVVVVWSAHFVLHLYQSALPPLYLVIQKDFGISWTEVGLIGSIFTLTNILQGFFGFFVDKYGGKKVGAIGMIAYSGAVFAYGLSPSFIILLTLVFIAGIGSATFHPASYPLISSNAPRQHLAKFLSYHSFIGFVGGAVGTVLVAFVATYINWRVAIMIIPIPGLLIIFLFLLIVKAPKDIHEQEMKTRKTTHEVKPSTAIPMVLSAVLLNSLGGVGGYLPAFLSIVYGESTAVAGLESSMMQIVGCIGTLASGIFADRYDRILVISFSWLLSGILKLTLAMTLLPSATLQSVIMFYGFSTYISGPALHAFTASSSAEGRVGRSIGLQFAAGATGSTASSIFQGYLIDLYGMRFAFVSTTIFSFTAVTILLSIGYIIPRLRKDNKSSHNP